MPVQELPPTFTEYHEKTNFLAFIDIDIIPFNCLLEVDFHDKLVGMTVMPIAFIFLICVLYAMQYARLLRQAEDTEKEIALLQVKTSVLPLSCLASFRSSPPPFFVLTSILIVFVLIAPLLSLV